LWLFELPGAEIPRLGLQPFSSVGEYPAAVVAK
jgi:hypothetical protein